jgi:hypothetical protein
MQRCCINNRKITIYVQSSWDTVREWFNGTKSAMSITFLNKDLIATYWETRVLSF